MKKLALFCGMAALGLCAMNAGAVVPALYETANITATLTVYTGEDPAKTISFNNKDMMTLISEEFGDFPAGAQLEIYDGLGWDGDSSDDSPSFYVVDPNGADTYVSSSADPDYELYFYPYQDYEYEWYVSGTEDTYVTECDQSEFYYHSAGSYYLYLYGVTKDTVNWERSPYPENFSMTMGQGAFYLPTSVVDVGDDEGIATGTFSGSGKVEFPWNPF